MSEASTAVTKSDFDRISWLEVVEKPGKDCLGIGRELFTLASQADASGDASASKAFALLGNCAWLHLVPSDISNPLQVVANFGVRRTPSISDIQVEDVAALRDLIPAIQNLELRARVADIVWLLKRDHRVALIAIDTYVEAAAAISDSQEWLDARDYLERALRLSFSLGKAAASQQKLVVGKLSSIVHDWASSDLVSLYPAHAMELLLAVGEGNAEHRKQHAETLASRASQQGGLGLESAEWYLRLAARWAHKLGDEAEAKRLRREAALIWADIADEFLGDRPSYLSAANFLLRAHIELSNVGDPEAAKKLEPKLFDVQLRAMDELKTSTTPINLKPIIEEFEGLFDGASLVRSLSLFVTHVYPLTREDIERKFKLDNGQIGLEMLIASHLMVDSRGRVVGRQKNREPSNSEDASNPLVLCHASIAG